VPDEDVKDASTRRGPTLGHVRALDGIRAVAVTAVVVYHAGVSRLHGGFLGVDVFFVLSGFLITSLLVTELSTRSMLAFGRFYERRARRLLPALVVLIAFVVFIAYVATPHGSYPQLSGQIVGTMAYIGNWTLISNHATYFSLGLPASPLQHTWSLAIEEQFYLVWPVVLFACWRLTRRRVVLAIGCIVGAMGCAAVTALLYAHGTSIDALYFATETHATTMLMGAALALFLLRERDAPTAGHFVAAPPRSVLAWNAVGAAAWLAVIALFVTVNGTAGTLYRGGYVVVGVVVAVAIGATILVPDGWSAKVLSLTPLVAIGQISYGIYLYHFPLFIWLDHGRTGLSGFALFCMRIAATLAAATLSFVLVERPIRERRFIRGWGGLAGSIAAFVGVAVLAISVTSAAASVPFADKVAKENLVRTAPPGTTTTILLVGDSMAQTLGDGLNNPLARAEHVFVSVIGDPKCSLVATEMRIKDFRFTPRGHCAWSSPHGLAARWGRRMRTLHPSLSMVLFRLDIVDHYYLLHWTHVGAPAYDCALERHLVDAAATLSAMGRPVVFLTTPYYSTGEQPNGAIWREDGPTRVRMYNRTLGQVASLFPNVVHVVDLNAMVSPGGGYTRTIGPTVVRWVDGVHFTYAGDAYVLPRLLRAILPIARSTPSRAALVALDGAARSGTPPACRSR
jgi:peptidoglycan/LPS O-acetylase OafA/YrhL